MILSVAIITYNEEKDLARTLNSVMDLADEIIIVDSGSTDATVEIAASFGAKIYQEEWKGFGRQKNAAIEKCSCPWILLIDADEEISLELKKEIKDIIHLQQCPYKVYKVPFVSFCFSKQIRHGGWSNFYRIRLFQNGSGKYDNREVHENFITNENPKALVGKINHYTYSNLNDYLEKLNLYTTQSAQEYYKANKTKSRIAVHLSAFFIFVKSYLFKLGFLDGYEGYLLSKLSALSVIVKYYKLQELYIKNKTTDKHN